MRAPILLAAALAAAVASADEPPPRVPDVIYRFTLGDSQGEHATSFSVLTYDRVHDELYAVAGDTVVVYKDGFEVFRFSADARMGGLYGVAVLDDGKLLILSTEGRLFRCNYRGRLIGNVTLSGVPGQVGAFKADRIQYVGGRVYLADSPNMKVLVVSPDGRFQAFHDLRAIISRERKTADYQIGGFGADDQGNLLFTIPPLFKAYVVSPRGDVKSFGAPGSRLGRFNIAGAIARDERGTLYVADVLRCVVILFDKDFNYLREVGGRGPRPGQLIGPSSVVVGNNWLFVSQGADRGVSAYRVY